MAIQNDSTLLCKGDLKAYHELIAPYLGGNFMVATNVSDFYNTDEKIVGIWTNGKPIYQKTFITTFPTLTTSGETKKDILIGSSIDTFIQIYGCFNYYNTNNIIMIPFTSDTGIVYLFGRSNISSSSPKNCICLSVNPKTTDMASRLSENPTIITVQYTKTTDAANSAIATPGCYDINRPDLWPVYSEIYFGNGLYGVRITDNGDGIQVTNGQEWSSTTSWANNVTKIVNSGGNLRKANAWVVNFGKCVWTDKVDSGFFFAPSTKELKVYIYNNSGSTQTFYVDAWVTYTK